MENLWAKWVCSECLGTKQKPEDRLTIDNGFLICETCLNGESGASKDNGFSKGTWVLIAIGILTLIVLLWSYFGNALFKP